MKKIEEGEKIVVLNSGGLDSVVLMNMLAFNDDYLNSIEKAEIHSLFFNYGQSHFLQEYPCALKVCENIHDTSGLPVHNITMNLPIMSWSKSSLFNSESIVNYQNEEVHFRNLIFISYALSYAKSIGATKIFIALIEGNLETSYFDCSVPFIDYLNSLTDLEGIEVIAPFIELNKLDIVGLSKLYGVKEDDYFSCNQPVDGEPCGKCGSCLNIKLGREMYIDINTIPAAVFDGTYADLKRVYYSKDITKVKLDVNKLEVITDVFYRSKSPTDIKELIIVIPPTQRLSDNLKYIKDRVYDFRKYHNQNLKVTIEVQSISLDSEILEDLKCVGHDVVDFDLQLNLKLDTYLLSAFSTRYEVKVLKELCRITEGNITLNVPFDSHTLKDIPKVLKYIKSNVTFNFRPCNDYISCYDGVLTLSTLFPDSNFNMLFRGSSHSFYELVQNGSDLYPMFGGNLDHPLYQHLINIVNLRGFFYNNIGIIDYTLDIPMFDTLDFTVNSQVVSIFYSKGIENTLKEYRDNIIKNYEDFYIV